MELNIRYLTEKDIIELGGADMTKAVHDMERVFVLKEAGDVKLPDKVSMGWGKNVLEEKKFGRINAMPGYLGGEYDMAGIKWIGSNPGNIEKGLPRASAITILNDPTTRFPVAIMNGALISAMRTGAASGVAVKYLSREDSKVAVLIGAGYQCTTQMEATVCVRPGLEEVYVSDLVFERAEKLAAMMSEKLGRQITPIADPREKCRVADIIITVTGAASPVIDADYLNPRGCLYINVGGYECTYDTVRAAGRIVVDNWNAVKHRKAGTVARMADEGLISDDQIYADLGRIVNGEKPGRVSPEEIIYYNGVGMGVEDIAIATRVYREAEKRNVGRILPY